MSAANYPFIDIAVLDAVRGRFAAGEALILLDVGLDSVLWANAPGAQLIGAHDLVSAFGMQSALSTVAMRQIRGAAGYHALGRPSQLLARITGRSLQLTVERVSLPDGYEGILLSSADSGLTHAEAAQRAIAGFTESGQYLAIVDHEATIQAATEGFETLGFSRQALAELVTDVRNEHDRLVKRRMSVGGRTLPVGFARLTDSPALHLLVTIDEGGEAQATGIGQEPEAQSAPAKPAPVSAPSEPVEVAAVGTGRTIRFLWRTDDKSRIVAVSDDFLEAAGIGMDQLAGKTFDQLGENLGVFDAGQIGALLERRDTWSGRTVQWPVGKRAIPVDLAALPAYNRDRNFEGFRGFGVARFGDAQPLPERVTPAPVEPVPDDSLADEEALADLQRLDGADEFRNETPALQSAVTKTPVSEKVIHLSERRGAAERALSQAERSAFREIGDRLRGDGEQSTTPFGKRTAGPTPVESDDEPAEATPHDVAAMDDDAAIASGEHAALTEPHKAQADQERTTAHDESSTFASSDDLVQEADIELEAAAATDIEPVEEPPLDAEVAALAPPAADTSIVERLPVPVLIHSGDELHYANPEFLTLTGYPSLQHLQDAGGLDALFAEDIGDEADDDDRQLRLRRKDGVEFPIDALLRSVKWRAGNALMLVVRVAGDGDDDTPALAEARTRITELRTILDTATDGVVLIDSDGSIRSISRPAEALFGFDSDDLAGKPFTSLFAIESQPVAREYLTGLSEHGVASLLNDGREVIGRESQGRFIPLFMTIGRMPSNTGYCAVLRDVTQWKRAEEELSQSRRLAERASSQKTDFLARVSHEIRTPLNAIIGFSELMLDEKFGPVSNDRYRDYLRDINRSGSHVLDLVNDLLDITKIEAGEQEMSYEAVSLNDTLAEAVAIMQPQANRERVIIRSSFSTNLPHIVADLRSVRQIALNILSNAVRYTQAGGQVIISTAYEQSGDVVMRVRDTGVGMSQSEIEQALKPFKQLNALNRTRGDGTGLGLPLTKAMVEANRARFVITSAPSEGTLVEVVFPSTRVLAQ